MRDGLFIEDLTVWAGRWRFWFGDSLIPLLLSSVQGKFFSDSCGGIQTVGSLLWTARKDIGLVNCT